MQSSPALAETFGLLQEMARGGKLPVGILEIEAFADSADEKIALNVAFDAYPKPAAELAEYFRAALPRIESLLLLDQKKERFELTGPGFLMHEAGGFQFRVSHLSFFQVNRFLIEELLSAVTKGTKGELALDLYAGVGFFTLPLAKTFTKVVSVDANLAATRDSKMRTRELAGVEVRLLLNEHTEDGLKNAGASGRILGVFDPPRAGLGAPAAAKLVELGAPEIVYLSCDPSTLARDLAILTGSAKKPAQGAAASGPFWRKLCRWIYLIYFRRPFISRRWCGCEKWYEIAGGGDGRGVCRGNRYRPATECGGLRDDDGADGDSGGGDARGSNRKDRAEVKSPRPLATAVIFFILREGKMRPESAGVVAAARRAGGRRGKNSGTEFPGGSASKKAAPWKWRSSPSSLRTHDGINKREIEMIRMAAGTARAAWPTAAAYSENCAAQVGSGCRCRRRGRVNSVSCSFFRRVACRDRRAARGRRHRPARRWRCFAERVGRGSRTAMASG